MNVRKKLSLAALCFTLPAMASAQAAPAPAAPAAEPAAAPAPAPAAAPAAPKATVTVGGTLNVNFQITQAKGATVPAESVKARQAVSTDSSNIFVDAGADVAFGLKAIGRCETSAAVDGIGTSGICNRNSRVGLSSAEYGTLFYGNWDTPFKAVAYGTKVDDPFMSTDVFGFQSIMGSPGANYRSGAFSTASDSKIGGFDIRAQNSVAYHSPKLEGAQVKLQYVASEFSNATNATSTAHTTSSPTLVSASVNYDIQGLSLVAAYEHHWDAYGLAAITAGAPAANRNGTAHGTSDWAWRAGVGYQLDSPAGATTLSFLIDQLVFQQEHAGANTLKEYKRLAWQVAAKHRYGDHELRARFDSADSGECKLGGANAPGCETVDLGAKQITVGYAYYLSKGAQAYLSYTRLMNEQNAQYTLTIGGSPAVAGSTPRGADPQALGLGVRYAF